MTVPARQRIASGMLAALGAVGVGAGQDAGELTAANLHAVAQSESMPRESMPRDGLARAAAGHDDNYVYRLPYGNEVSYSVLQAYGSRLSHRGSEYYTVDFGMPEGTLVHSAREGRVLATEDRNDRSCWTEDCDGYANFVEIRHPDGTVGRYFHLQQGSVLVEPGQWVERGEAIARSGDTGFATVPHLHFGVYRISGGGAAQSIAVRFVVRGGQSLKPRTGARYINAPD